VLSEFSPYWREHINRFGMFTLNMDKTSGITNSRKGVLIRDGNFYGLYRNIINFAPDRATLDIEDESNKYSNSNSGNIICNIGDGGNFILLSHMDTARSTKQLEPLVLSDRITSSGNTVLGVDNRAGISVLLHLLKKIRRGKFFLKFPSPNP